MHPRTQMADPGWQRFDELLSASENPDILDGALMLAAVAWPEEVDEHWCRAFLNDLARDAGRVLGERLQRQPADALCYFLRDVQGFSGNALDYFDPDNSFLNRVLERRTGIPITLALVYLHVARTLGFRAEGVGFPGHFLVRLWEGDQPVLIDPFDGRVLSEEGLEQLLKRHMGAGAALSAHFLAPASGRDILRRMLVNLKRIYLDRGDFELALTYCDRLLHLAPESVVDIRDRALVYEQLGAVGAAVHELERLLTMPLDASWHDAIGAKLRDLRTKELPHMH